MDYHGATGVVRLCALYLCIGNGFVHILYSICDKCNYVRIHNNVGTV